MFDPAPTIVCRIHLHEYASVWKTGPVTGTLMYRADVDLFDEKDDLIRSVKSDTGDWTGVESDWQPYGVNITVPGAPLPHDIYIEFPDGSYDDQGVFHPLQTESKHRRATAAHPVQGDNFAGGPELIKRDKLPGGLDFDLAFKILDTEVTWNTHNNQDQNVLPYCEVGAWDTKFAEPAGAKREVTPPDPDKIVIPDRQMDCYFPCRP